MGCVTSTCYNISHVVRVFGPIIPKREIRYGDPLSSYLFLIYMEGFTDLIQDYGRRIWLEGFKWLEELHPCHICFLRTTFTHFAELIKRMLVI